MLELFISNLAKVTFLIHEFRFCFAFLCGFFILVVSFLFDYLIIIYCNFFLFLEVEMSAGFPLPDGV